MQRKNRLSRSRDFDAVYRHGRSASTRFLTLHWFERSPDDDAGEPVGGSACKYHPSCSQYASDALRRYGPVCGSLKAAWRLARCNPWSRGGIDYA